MLPSIWLHFFLWVSLSGPIFTLLSLLGLSVHGLGLEMLHLLLFQCGGVIRPTHYSVGPKPCDPGCLLRDVQYIICQGHGRPLLCPGKIIGEAMHWNPLCFVLGWGIRQDTPLEYQGPRNAQVGSPFIHDLELCCWHHGVEVYCLAAAVAIQLCFCEGLWYGHCGWPNQLVLSI